MPFEVYGFLRNNYCNQILSYFCYVMFGRVDEVFRYNILILET